MKPMPTKPRKKETPPMPEQPVEKTLGQQIAEKRTEAQRIYNEKSATDKRYAAAEAEIAALERQAREQRNAAFLSVLTDEVINALAPEHSRSSCSDEGLGNVDRGCTRCQLLEFKANEYIPDSVTFQVEVRRY